MITVRNLEPEPQQAAPNADPGPQQVNLFNEPEPVRSEPIKTEPITNNSELEPIQVQAILAATLGAHVEITGQWVWAAFNGKPDTNTLSQLKANKWIWCRNKVKWAYRGAPCHSKKNMSWDYITNKYGIKTIETENKLVGVN